jgi:acyl dehydratase
MTVAHQQDATRITKELATGKFTDKMLDDMRALIGMELRTEASINNEYATRMAILRFCEGIGDDNPLFTDVQYAASGPYGTQIAPPSFIFACMGSVQVGWRGLGGFHCETKMEFNHPIRVGDKIEASVTFDGFDGPTADSNFGGRRIKDYLRQEYHNQNGDLVSTFICSRMRFERGEMQKRAETRKLEVPHPWKEEVRRVSLFQKAVFRQPRRAYQGRPSRGGQEWPCKAGKEIQPPQRQRSARGQRGQSEWQGAQEPLQ